MSDAEPLSVGHRPVMLPEVLAVLRPRDGGVYVDGTFGAGGYSRGMLEAARCTVWGLDRDPAAVGRAAGLVREFAGRLTVLLGRFGEMDRLLGDRGVGMVDGIAFDLGMSSIQVEAPERGFSFRRDGPLDMRMEDSGPTAADIVNTESESGLAELVFTLGEERRARAIARAIVAARGKRPLTRTAELAAIVRRVTPPAAANAGAIDAATRTFQALRIHVNDELGELDRGLRAAERQLAAEGRLAVVSFHSLEDRRVQRFLVARSDRAPRPSRHAPDAGAGPAPTFRLVARKVATPRADEVAANRRARSARLRAAERTAAPAWEVAA